MQISACAPEFSWKRDGLSVSPDLMAHVGTESTRSRHRDDMDESLAAYPRLEGPGRVTSRLKRLASKASPENGIELP